MNQELLDFRWVMMTPEQLPVLDLSGYATVASVLTVKQETEQSLAAQAAAIGAQIVSEVGKEQLINASIQASVDSTATRLIELQTTAFNDLSQKIQVVTDSVTNVDSKVGLVDSRVSTVDSRVTDAQRLTDAQFVQTNSSVQTVVNSVNSVVSSVQTVSQSLDATNVGLAVTNETNAQQNIVLTELVKGVVNLREVSQVILDSIPA